MRITILGPGCSNCAALERLATDTVAELGVEATIDKVTDYGEIASWGVMSTPGLAIDGTVVSAGRVPSATLVRELIAAAGTSTAD